MPKTVAALLFLLAVFAQTAPGPHMMLLGGQVDLLLVAVAAWAVVRGFEEVMQTAPPAALLAGLLAGGPIGMPLLCLLVPVGLAVLCRSRNHGDRLPALLVVVLASTIMAFMLGVATDLLTGAGYDRLTGAGTVLLGTILLNLLVAIIFYQPLRLVRTQKPVERTRVGLSYDLGS